MGGCSGGGGDGGDNGGAGGLAGKGGAEGGEVGWAAGFVALAASLAAVAEKPVVRVTAVVVAAQAAHTVSPQGQSPLHTSHRLLRLQSGTDALSGRRTLARDAAIGKLEFRLWLGRPALIPTRRPVKGTHRVLTEARRVENLVPRIVRHHRPRHVDKHPARLAKRVADG